MIALKNKITLQDLINLTADQDPSKVIIILEKQERYIYPNYIQKEEDKLFIYKNERLNLLICQRKDNYIVGYVVLKKE